MKIILMHVTDENMNLGIEEVSEIIITNNRLYWWSEGNKCQSVSLKHAETIDIMEEEDND